ncbi:MAG: hypothetical protein RMY28_012575 [Nostoc sp. ChiSLP01]|nr:hypothetical protein [Nostoc sp. CmiSLP01]MDZ8285464.1 hypothetical protein [Nostoc sp. ChiSLP01]
MGFANLSIAEIAADYSMTVEKLFSLDNQLLIADKHQKSRLALEDAKAIIFRISSDTRPKVGNSVGDTEITSGAISDFGYGD